MQGENLIVAHFDQFGKSRDEAEKGAKKGPGKAAVLFQASHGIPMVYSDR